VSKTTKTIESLRKQAKAEAQAELRKAQARADIIPDVGEVEENEVEQTTAMKPTVTSRTRGRVFVMPETKPKEKKVRVPAEKKSRRLDEAAILAKYPHAIKGTMQFDEVANKQSIEAKLACGHRDRVYTSDLFQIKRCENCKKIVVKEKLAALKAKDKAPIKSNIIPISHKTTKKAK